MISDTIAEDIYIQYMKKHFPELLRVQQKAHRRDMGVKVKRKNHFFLPSTGNYYEDEIEEYLQESDEECDERVSPLTAKNSEWCQQKPVLPRTTQIVIEDSFGELVHRLCEPWDLYGLSAKHQLPCWPQECEVIKERIKHIVGVSIGPEPLYRATGLEQAPIYINPEEGELVYSTTKDYMESSFTFSRVSGSSKPLKQATINVSDPNNTLMFESRFESGNLEKVFKVGDYEYNLMLRTDLYTAKHTQWYYFQVQNVRPAVQYRFTIINLMKPTSLYNMGMKPLLYSTKDAELLNVGWRRVGSQIKYYRNNYGNSKHHYYSLTWTFEFPHAGDVCYFAHCYPYTYTDLQDYVKDVVNDPAKSKFCKVRVLCRSLAGNMVYVLTVTNPSQSSKAALEKKAVILTARVHPGETNSSWMMKGFLDYLLGNSMDARLLRDTFLFKIVPMLNPDGVIVGNYRCSLSGQDLNRKYRSYLKESYPSVFYTRKLIKRLMEERTVFLYCDLHGHSRKQNIFMYGCQSRRRTVSSYAKQRVFPFMLSKNCCNKFCFKSCKFHVKRAKEGTGRVVVWRMGVTNSYTLEATFCGSTLGNSRDIHFNVNDLESVGFEFCDTLLDYCDPDQSKYIQCKRQLQNQIKEHIAAKMEMSGTRYDSDASLGDILSYIESSTTGSNSSESDDQSLHFRRKAHEHVTKRKKQLKTKKQRQNSYLIRKVLNTEKQYQQTQAHKKPQKTHAGKHEHYLNQVPDQNDSDLDSAINVLQHEASGNVGKWKSTEDLQITDHLTFQKPKAAPSQAETATKRAFRQSHGHLEEHETGSEHEEPPNALRDPGHLIAPQRNCKIDEGKVSPVLRTEEITAISEARLETSEGSIYDDYVSGGINMRLHHPSNTITEDCQNSDSIFSVQVHKKHAISSKCEFEWVPRKQTSNLKTSPLKPQSMAAPAPFFPIKKTKLPVIDRVQNRSLRASRRETLYKVFAVPPVLLTASSLSESISTTTEYHTTQDSAHVEQARSRDIDPHHQEEVCLFENTSTVPTGLATNRLENRGRNCQPCPGKQAFSEEEANPTDGASRALRITGEGIDNQIGLDQKAVFTQMWRGVPTHISRNQSKHLSGVITRTLSTKPTRPDCSTFVQVTKGQSKLLEIGKDRKHNE
ncbi:cytosolic carboxypeptidase 2-like [Stegostoma tigrinum]|uniref:cytosolic carboxypeptidase 2-like n=1 Tax=Stegostoma tigrinum TaxID=3053191 RepID=UPI00286FFA25|nr:cytosolic carboxypeptidase 2-like [Stegostoma tigrinum]